MRGSLCLVVVRSEGATCRSPGGPALNSRLSIANSCRYSGPCAQWRKPERAAWPLSSIIEGPGGCSCRRRSPSVETLRSFQLARAREQEDARAQGRACARRCSWRDVGAQGPTGIHTSHLLTLRALGTTPGILGAHSWRCLGATEQAESNEPVLALTHSPTCPCGTRVHTLWESLGSACVSCVHVSGELFLQGLAESVRGRSVPQASGTLHPTPETAQNPGGSCRRSRGPEQCRSGSLGAGPCSVLPPVSRAQCPAGPERSLPHCQPSVSSGSLRCLGAPVSSARSSFSLHSRAPQPRGVAFCWVGIVHHGQSEPSLTGRIKPECPPSAPSLLRGSGQSRESRGAGVGSGSGLGLREGVRAQLALPSTL